MANSDGQIRLEIVTDESGVVKSFKKLEDQADKTGKNVGKSLDDGKSRGVGKLAAGIRALGPVAIAAGAAIGGALFGRAAIAASAKQEGAVNRLNQALKSSGQFSEELSQDFQNFATQLQQTSTIGDETTLEMLSLATAMGATGDQAKDLVQAAANLSAETGISLQSAVKNLGKTFGGLTGELGEVVPELRGLSKEALKSGAAIDFVNKRFAGGAQALTKTFSGATEQASNAFGDLLEGFGKFVTGSPALITVINEVTKLIGSIATKISEFAGSKDFLKPLINGFLIFAQVVNAIVVGPIELLINSIRTLVNGVITAATGLGELFGIVKEGATGEAFQDLKSSFEDTFAFDSTKAGNTFLQRVRDMVNQTKEGTKDAGRDAAGNFVEGAEETKDGFDAISESWDKATSKMKTSTDSLAKSVRSTLAGGVTNAFASVGAALAKGEDGFAALGKAVLATLGDIAIQYGSFLLLSGLGLSFIPGFQTSANAVPFGIGLIVLGGFLKGLAGGGTSTSSGAAGAAAGGGGGGVVGDQVIQEPEPEEIGDQTTVTVNVQGNILDRRETGIEIAEVINESFGSEGVTLAQAGA